MSSQSEQQEAYTKIVCEGYNHVVDISDAELEQKGIKSLEEFKTHWGVLCPYHLSVEFYKCNECLAKGYTRYDSLVLCEEHNKGMPKMVTKLMFAINGVDPDLVDQYWKE